MNSAVVKEKDRDGDREHCLGRNKQSETQDDKQTSFQVHDGEMLVKGDMNLLLYSHNNATR